MSDVLFYFLFSHLQFSAAAAAKSFQIKCKDASSLISVIQSLPLQCRTYRLGIIDVNFRVVCLFYLPKDCKKTEILKKNRILFWYRTHHQNSNGSKKLFNTA